MNHAAAPVDARARASVAAWLGALFLLLLALIAVGGFVRLTGSGLSIPHWPLDHGHVLPPVSEAQWVERQAAFFEDQARLDDLRAAGVAGIGSEGRIPQDLAQFKIMYLIEWSHRAVAAMLAIIALACTVVSWRAPSLRQAIGGRLAIILGLISIQAVLGGILVKSGTSTHWLFFHLGMAALILCLILWALLTLLRGEAPEPASELRAQREPLCRWHRLAFAFLFVQLVLGALVAGSRHNGFVVTWPLMSDSLIPHLWVHSQDLAWNLLDNWMLHQWLHRWFVLPATALLIIAGIKILRSQPTQRLGLGVHLAFSCLVGQICLGLGNVMMAVPLMVALAHLLLGMFLLCVWTLVGFDLRYETAESSAPRASAEGLPACA